jgi:hypothetical protein
MAALANAGKFDHRLTVLLPGQLPELVDRAAEKSFRSARKFFAARDHRSIEDGRQRESAQKIGTNG